MTVRTHPTKKTTVIVNRRGSEMWRFNKTFSLDTIVQLVGFALLIGGPILVWGRVMDARMLRVEATQEAAEKRSAEVDADNRERRTILAAQMKELNDRTLAIQIDVAKLVATQQQRGGFSRERDR